MHSQLGALGLASYDVLPPPVLRYLPTQIVMVLSKGMSEIMEMNCEAAMVRLD